jgi:DNA modification methylase
LRDEVIDSIAAQIQEAGQFDEAHALIVRPYNGHYQIIQGHHRKEGAIKAGLETVPCWVRDMTDEEAYMALALGNVQGELSPLEIGIHALKVVEVSGGGRGKQGGLANYARLTGQKPSNLTNYRNAAKVLSITRNHYNVIMVLDKAAHLAHIHKAPRSTWPLLAEWLITPNAKGKLPSTKQTETFVKMINKYLIPSEYSEFYPIESIVKSYIETEQPAPEIVNDLTNTIRGLESIIQANAAKFDFALFPFTVKDFRQWLRDGVGTYAWSKAALNEYRDDVIRAAQDAYKPQPANCQRGEWYKLGKHILYCGDTSQPEFWDQLPSVPFVFADPPYNAGVGEWDNDFKWAHDWIGDKGEVVSITPGIANIQNFFKNETALNCGWSMACWITNGMTRGGLGFGNWVYIALFSAKSLYKNAQDFVKVTVNTADTEDSKHEGRKPPQLMEKLISLFSDLDDTVIDPFLGSGTTLFEADKLGRKCIGGEIKPDFCNDIINRWQNMTGQVAEKMTDAENTA